MLIATSSDYIDAIEKLEDQLEEEEEEEGKK